MNKTELDLTRGLIYNEYAAKNLERAFAMSIQLGILPQLVRLIARYSDEHGEDCYYRTRLFAASDSPYNLYFIWEKLEFTDWEKGWQKIFNGFWHLDEDRKVWSSNT